MTAVILSVPEFVAWTGVAPAGEGSTLSDRILGTGRFLEDAEYSELGRLVLGARLSHSEPEVAQNLANALEVTRRAVVCLHLYRGGSSEMKGYLFAFDARVAWIEVRETGIVVQSGGVDLVETLLSSLVDQLRNDDIIYVKSETLSGDDIGMAWSRGSARRLRASEWFESSDVDVSDAPDVVRSFVLQAGES